MYRTSCLLQNKALMQSLRVVQLPQLASLNFFYLKKKLSVFEFLDFWYVR